MANYKKYIDNVKLIELGKVRRDSFLYKNKQNLFDTFYVVLDCDIDASQSNYPASFFTNTMKLVIGLYPVYDSLENRSGTRLICHLDKFFCNIVLKDTERYDLKKILDMFHNLPFEYQGREDITGLQVKNYEIKEIRCNLGFRLEFTDDAVEAKFRMLYSENTIFHFYLNFDNLLWTINCGIYFANSSKPEERKVIKLEDLNLKMQDREDLVDYCKDFLYNHLGKI